MVPLPQCRNLKELLKEEQEPFQSHNPKQNVPFRSGLPRNACFCTSSSSSSPDTFRKSPLFLPAANKKNTSDALFLHVPPSTASLLLEAALRVLNNSDSKPRFRHSGFGLLNSVVKRLRIRTRTQIQKTGDEDVVRWAKSSETPSNTSGSSPSSYFRDNANELEEEGKQVEDIRVVSGDNNGSIGDEDFPSPSRTSQAFSMSPSCPTLQENLNYEKKLDKKQAVKSLVEEDEEEKEQKSPVSILDSPFEDDDCHGEEDEEFHREDGRSDLECSFAFIQRAKRRVLLNKLQKFDELAHLNPIKLDDIMEDEEEEEGDECGRNEFEMNIDVSLPWMKRLVYDIISEEQKTLMKSSEELNYNELIRNRVWKRLESWREVEDNTIDMMIGIDFRREGGEWKKQGEDDDISWTAREIESSIFAGLVQEFVRELV